MGDGVFCPRLFVIDFDCTCVLFLADTSEPPSEFAAVGIPLSPLGVEPKLRFGLALVTEAFDSLISQLLGDRQLPFQDLSSHSHEFPRFLSSIADVAKHVSGPHPELK